MRFWFKNNDFTGALIINHSSCTFSYPSEIAQLVEANESETTENSERPIMVTAGAMVSGVTNLRTSPTMPR